MNGTLWALVGGLIVLLLLSFTALLLDPAIAACWHTDPYTTAEAECYADYYTRITQ